MKKLLFIVLCMIFTIGIIVSLSHIIPWYKDKNNQNKTISELDKAKEDDSINFDLLKEMNDETVGWIQVPGTNIDYPFVQTKDNSYYLNHSFDKKINSAGWIFMDYRNNHLQDDNTILYAHGRVDKTMFGSLQNVLNDDWYQDLDNHIIKISTPDENSLWQIFSTYHILTTDDYLKTNLSDEEFDSFINLIIKRSSHSFGIIPEKKDQILTLSTCYNSKEKMVVHAKLLIKEKMNTES